MVERTCVLVEVLADLSHCRYCPSTAELRQLRDHVRGKSATYLALGHNVSTRGPTLRFMRPELDGKQILLHLRTLTATKLPSPSLHPLPRMDSSSPASPSDDSDEDELCPLFPDSDYECHFEESHLLWTDCSFCARLERPPFPEPDDV